MICLKGHFYLPDRGPAPLCGQHMQDVGLPALKIALIGLPISRLDMDVIDGDGQYQDEEGAHDRHLDVALPDGGAE